MIELDAFGLFWAFFMTFIVSIIFHELGHFISLYTIKKEISIRFYKDEKGLTLSTGSPWDYKDLSAEQKFNVYSFGIYAGIIPIAISIFAINWLCVLLAFPYVWGCRKDLRSAIKFNKDTNDEKEANCADNVPCNKTGEEH